MGKLPHFSRKKRNYIVNMSAVETQNPVSAKLPFKKDHSLEYRKIVAQFMWIIRKRIDMPAEKAIFLFVNKVIPSAAKSMGELYEEQKDLDGFLYIQYSGENTFGCN